MDHTQVPGLVEALQPIINQYGYLAVAFLLFIEDFGVPAPGETTLIAAAFFAGLGQLNIFVVLLVAFLAAVLGDNVGYLIGSKGGHPLVLKFGKYVFVTPARLHKAEGFFNRHGGKVVLVARFVEGLRQLNGIVAGISEMTWRRFLAFNALGAALWVTAWGLIGYFGGNHIDAIYSYSAWAAAGVFGLLIIYLVYRFAKKRGER
ncbi:MAG TPA: DedA family protein [Candidatus Saccharimonadales bacterium]|nr:DedA family protein [Candidatus Saccharimonadales bacterium]